MNLTLAVFLLLALLGHSAAVMKVITDNCPASTLGTYVAISHAILIAIAVVALAGCLLVSLDPLFT